MLSTSFVDRSARSSWQAGDAPAAEAERDNAPETIDAGESGVDDDEGDERGSVIADIVAESKMLAAEGPQGPMPESPISAGTYKDGVVAFSVVREFGGNSFTIKYTGKLEGDKITGTSEFPGFNGGEPTKREWNPTRAK